MTDTTLRQPCKAYLKVKSKHLAAEARIIKNDELKWKRKAAKAKLKMANRDNMAENIRRSLYHHRKDVLRPESRALNVALAFMRGYPYERVEVSFHDSRFGVSGKFAETAFRDFWERVVELVVKYSRVKTGAFDAVGEPIYAFATKEEVEKQIYPWLAAHPGVKESPYAASLVARKAVS